MQTLPSSASYSYFVFICLMMLSEAYCSDTSMQCSMREMLNRSDDKVLAAEGNSRRLQLLTPVRPVCSNPSALSVALPCTALQLHGIDYCRGRQSSRACVCVCVCVCVSVDGGGWSGRGSSSASKEHSSGLKDHHADDIGGDDDDGNGGDIPVVGSIADCRLAVKAQNMQTLQRHLWL